jgi:hypothetical protein
MKANVDKQKLKYVRFEVLTAVTVKNAFFRDVKPCDSCKNRRFGERISFIIRLKRMSEVGTSLPINTNLSTLRRKIRIVLRLLVTANAFPSSMILFILMMEATRSSGT